MHEAEVCDYDGVVVLPVDLEEDLLAGADNLRTPVRISCITDRFYFWTPLAAATACMKAFLGHWVPSMTGV